jgi:hypothetical protein
MKCPNYCYIDDDPCSICNNTGRVLISVWLKEKISTFLFYRKLKKYYNNLDPEMKKAIQYIKAKSYDEE